MKILQENSALFRENTQKIAAFFGLGELYLLQDSKKVPVLPDSFPSKTTLHKFAKKSGAELPTMKTVNGIVDFCNRTFEFTIPLTAKDLLTQPLGELRLISSYRRRPEARQWLSGTFFCYYYERDYAAEPETGPLVLRGGILRLDPQEDQGIRKARLVLGFTSAGLTKRAAAELFEGTASADLFTKYQTFRSSVREDEKSIYFFEGTVRDDASVITGELKKRIPNNVGTDQKEERVSLFIHGHAVSAHDHYQGGLALALRFVLEDKTFQAFRFGISPVFLEWTAPQLAALLIPRGVDALSVDYRADKTWYQFSLKQQFPQQAPPSEPEERDAEAVDRDDPFSSF